MLISGLRGFASQAPSLESLQKAITPGVCAALSKFGVSVVDNVFGNKTAALLREEIKALRPHMFTNCTHLVTGAGPPQLVPKQNIFEAELMMAETQALAPLCSLLQYDRTLATMLNVHIPGLSLAQQAIKLQWNASSVGENKGGGCFPMHTDDAALDSRVVTAIWYLNPDWKDGDGGELRVYPWPMAGPIDIAPINDRLVLFSSQKMVHRVLPSLADRYCFTIWLSAEKPTTSAAVQEAERGIARQLLSSPVDLTEKDAERLLEVEEVRRHAIKWYYREEWALSLEESHPQGPEREQLLSNFWREIEVIERALRPLLPALQNWEEGKWGGSIKWL